MIESVLITGGSGYFGRGFARAMLDRGARRVCIYSRGEYAQATMRQEFEDDPRLRWFIGDVRDLDRLLRAMRGVDLVIHAAALKRIEVGCYNPDEMVKTNIGGAMNVIDAATSGGVSRVVALSTDKAFQPVSPYGHSKAMAECLFLNANRAHGPRFAVTRYGNVSGSTGSVIPVWRKVLEKTDTVTVTDPECTRFWMTLKEAVDLVIDTAINMDGGELKVPTLPAYRLGDLAEAMGAKMKVVGLPEHEKRHESMSNENSSDRARRMTTGELREALQGV